MSAFPDASHFKLTACQQSSFLQPFDIHASQFADTCFRIFLHNSLEVIHEMLSVAHFQFAHGFEEHKSWTVVAIRILFGCELAVAQYGRVVRCIESIVCHRIDRVLDSLAVSSLKLEVRIGNEFAVRIVRESIDQCFLIGSSIFRLAHSREQLEHIII